MNLDSADLSCPLLITEGSIIAAGGFRKLSPKMRSFLWLVQIMLYRAVDQTIVKFLRLLQLR